MLIAFKVSNFRSFEDGAELSLKATSLKEHPENLLKDEKGLKLLKSAVIYGANASGKFN